MSTHTHPCIMTSTDQFYHRICSCGTVHLAFGPTTLHLSIEAFIAVSETLSEVSDSLKHNLRWSLEQQLQKRFEGLSADVPVPTPLDNVIRPVFPKKAHPRSG